MNLRQPKSLILALTRRERAELRELRTRINNVLRVFNALVARRNFILSRVPDHKIHVPKIPNTASTPPVQPSLF